ncbi:hypothetical protein [Nocardia harenae]|uniref:hypothetical protein n=1 Tax=Nocardia harenae TaxID=358707 RepID=UPI000830A60F|nr:hypothetical protein [Nocardia harenae]
MVRVLTETTFPPVTRMILRADGSMTRLLEALVDADLGLNLTEQRATTGGELPVAVRAALGCADRDPVVVRRSALVTGSGSTVSRNTVVIVDTDRELTALLTDGGLPIGHSLAAAGKQLARTVIRSGLTRWDGVPCAYKESVLSDASAPPTVHLHERFNPAFVPVGRCRS